MAAHLSIDDLKIMAEDLPSAIGKSSDSRSRLLCVLDILKTYTDENHGLTANQIREILKYRLGAGGSKPSEPTILKALQILIDCHIQGLTIENPLVAPMKALSAPEHHCLAPKRACLSILLSPVSTSLKNSVPIYAAN